MRRRLVGITGVLVTLVTVGAVGCASLGLGGFKDPIVNFRGVQINGLGTQGGNMDVVLSVYNPNHFKLQGTRLTYRLLVDSSAVGTGALDQGFAVNQGDSTVVHLPVSFSYSGLGAVGRQLMQQGVVNYRVVGDVTVSTPIGNFTRPYDRTGRFSSLGVTR